MKKLSCSSMSDGEKDEPNILQRKKSIIDDLDNSFEQERNEILNIQDHYINCKVQSDYKLCVELSNNSRLYILTEPNWKIKDLIRQVLAHPEFRKLYYKKAFNLNSLDYSNHFDLELLMFRGIKEEKERVIDFDNKLTELFNAGLLNNWKTPFFCLKDNLNTGMLQINKDSLVLKHKELICAYSDKLPRVNSICYFINYPEMEQLFDLYKTPINNVSKINFNSLISENNYWMSYDDESLGFLMKMEDAKFQVNENFTKYDNKGNIYIQDSLPNILLDINEYKSFLINIILNKEQSMKLAVALTTTLRELIDTISKKLNKFKKNDIKTSESIIDVNTKILKASMLNDYVFDADIPLGQFVYVHEKLKDGEIPEYQLVDRPVLANKEYEGLVNDEINENSKIRMFNRSETIVVKDRISLLKRTTLKFDNPSELNELKQRLNEGSNYNNNKIADNSLDINKKNSSKGNVLSSVNNLASYNKNPMLSNRIQQLTNIFSKNTNNNTDSNSKIKNTLNNNNDLNQNKINLKDNKNEIVNNSISNNTTSNVQKEIEKEKEKINLQKEPLKNLDSKETKDNKSSYNINTDDLAGFIDYIENKIFENIRTRSSKLNKQLKTFDKLQIPNLQGIKNKNVTNNHTNNNTNNNNTKKQNTTNFYQNNQVNPIKQSQTVTLNNNKENNQTISSNLNNLNNSNKDKDIKRNSKPQDDFQLTSIQQRLEKLTNSIQEKKQQEKENIEQDLRRTTTILQKPIFENNIFVEKIKATLEKKDSQIISNQNIKTNSNNNVNKNISQNTLSNKNDVKNLSNLELMKKESKKSISKGYIPIQTQKTLPGESFASTNISSSIKMNFSRLNTHTTNNTISTFNTSHLPTTMEDDFDGSEELNPLIILDNFKKDIKNYDFYIYKENTTLSERISFLYLEAYNSPVHLLSLKYPFKFKLISINKLASGFKVENPLLEKVKKFDLIFSATIMIGKESLANEFKLTFKNINKKQIESEEFNYNFNTDIVFKGVLFSQLPLFSSILIKLALVECGKKDNKDNKEGVNNAIAWTNFKIFDYKDCFKSGKFKLNLNKQEFGDFSYFNWSDNIDSSSINSSAFECFIEMPSFSKSVRFPSTKNTTYNNSESSNNNLSSQFNNTENSRNTVSFNNSQNRINLDNFMISESDSIIIDKITKLNPFEEMSSMDKSTLWSNRYVAVTCPKLIPRLLQSMDSKQHDNLVELNKVLENAELMEPIESLQLLTGDFLHAEVRSYAVKCLKQFNHYRLSEFLIQLVQALKYEPHHLSDLAEYLLELAVQYPATFGHTFFWCLRSEMYNQNIMNRYGLMLEVFLSKVGKRFYKFLEREIWLVNSLLKIADIPFDKKFKEKSMKELMLSTYRGALKNLGEEFGGKTIPLPTNFKKWVKGIVSEKCKVMKSKKRPLWIAFELSEDSSSNITSNNTNNKNNNNNTSSSGIIENVMFKKGDDLRQDILTLQIFKIMRTMWFERGINLKMSIYPVVATGYFQGMLEMIKNSETLCTIHKIYGGAKAAFSKEPLKKWFDANCSLGEKEYINNFKLSCAAYCVSTFVLGIGDRHNDNIMVKNNGELFHIDFGHFLGHFKQKYGFKRERAPFVFTREFKKVLGGKKTEDYKDFKDKCLKSFKILRENVVPLVSLLRMMLCTNIPELFDGSIKFLHYSLGLSYTKDDEIEKFFEEKFSESLYSFSTKLMFAIHVIAN